jgi:hypothetical protein
MVALVSSGPMLIGTDFAGAAPKPQTAKSKECSAQADKQGLHGKDRRKFRSKCMRGK